MSDRRSKIEALARHGATEGEREAASAALSRLGDPPLTATLARAVVLLLEAAESSSGRVPPNRTDEHARLLAALRSALEV